MTEIKDLQPQNKISKYGFVTEILDCSEPMITRYHVSFTNNLGLSVIRGPFTFGGNKGLFEIALFSDDNLSEPIGYLTQEEVVEYIVKVGRDSDISDFYLD